MASDPFNRRMTMTRRQVIVDTAAVAAIVGLKLPAAIAAPATGDARGGGPSTAGAATAASAAGTSDGPGPGSATGTGGGSATGGAAADLYPTQSPDEVREMVRVAHFDLARVRAILKRRPALARAAWDWGFGDWETALGAASHMGNRPIAELLLAHGARPDLFSAAMLGQLDVVRAHVQAWPGAKTIRGPHGITLLAHARAGGAASRPVLDYLGQLGGADPELPLQPLASGEREAMLGSYSYGPRPDEVFLVETYQDGLTVKRIGAMARPLLHLGSRVFSPMGAEAVRLRFSAETPAALFAVHDPDVVVTARRVAA
jgi:hypothetical protein